MRNLCAVRRSLYAGRYAQIAVRWTLSDGYSMLAALRWRHRLLFREPGEKGACLPDIFPVLGFCILQ